MHTHTHTEEHNLHAQVYMLNLLLKHQSFVADAAFTWCRSQLLQRKAEERNPDEFYFAMEKSRTKEGVHDARCVHKPRGFNMQECTQRLWC